MNVAAESTGYANTPVSPSERERSSTAEQIHCFLQDGQLRLFIWGDIGMRKNTQFCKLRSHIVDQVACIVVALHSGISNQRRSSAVLMRSPIRNSLRSSWLLLLRLTA